MRLSLFLLVILFSGPASAAETITISEVTGPLSFKAGETEYVLDGLFAGNAGNELISGMTGQKLSIEGNKTDRWGRLIVKAPALAQLLLREGKAQLMPLNAAPDEAERAAELEARSKLVGLWGNDCCQLLTPQTAGKHLNGWHVVAARVASVTVQRNVTYLNFGSDWRTDFTVVIPARLAREIKPEDWAGRKIEVRGYLEWRYGPSITLSHAAQIVLPEAQTP